MSDDVEFKMVRCERCAVLINVLMATKLDDEGKVLNFCGDPCMSAWLVQ